MNRSKEKGKKFDKGKPMVDLVDPKFIIEIAEILTHGACKYGLENWKNRLAVRRIYAALQRHLLAWHSGELIDGETNKSHLAHAGCCLMFLMWYNRRGRCPHERQ